MKKILFRTFILCSLIPSMWLSAANAVSEDAECLSLENDSGAIFSVCLEGDVSKVKLTNKTKSEILALAHQLKKDAVAEATAKKSNFAFGGMSADAMAANATSVPVPAYPDSSENPMDDPLSDAMNANAVAVPVPAYADPSYAAHMTATTTAVPVPAYADPSYAAHMTATTTAVPVPAYADPSLLYPGYAAHMTATTTAVPVPAYPDPSLLYPGYAAHMTATTTAVPVPAYPDPSTVDPMGDPMSQE